MSKEEIQNKENYHKAMVGSDIWFSVRSLIRVLCQKDENLEDFKEDLDELRELLNKYE